MPNSRYHIHVIQVLDDQPLVSSQLALFLENKAFITENLPAFTEQTLNYSRRCIESCDFIIMVIGDSYGAPNLSGVSQMHLSYLTAKTKNKPLLVLLKSPSAVQRDHKLVDFIYTVEARDSQPVHYYQDPHTFYQVLTEAYDTITEDIQQAGWVKLNIEPTKISSLDLQSKPSITSRKSSTLNKISPITTTRIGDTRSHQKSHSTGSKKTSSLKESSRGASSKATRDHLKSGALSEDAIEAIVSQSLSDEFMTVTDTTQAPYSVKVDNSVELTYDAHAYQDGNLSDVTLNFNTSWRRLLQMLDKLGRSFSTEAMYRSLNNEVARSAIKSVVEIMPKAHAVSRCVVRPQDFEWVQEQMTYNGWIELVDHNRPGGREFWKLTKKAVDEIQNNA